MLALSYEHKDVAMLLIDKGAKIDLQNKFGITALSLAANNGYKDIVIKLIEKGAKSNELDQNLSEEARLLIIEAISEVESREPETKCSGKQACTLSHDDIQPSLSNSF